MKEYLLKEEHGKKALKAESCLLCTNHCRDCRHLEMENDYYNDGTRRCDYKGRWVRPSDEACGNFSY